MRHISANCIIAKVYQIGQVCKWISYTPSNWAKEFHQWLVQKMAPLETQGSHFWSTDFITRTFYFEYM